MKVIVIFLAALPAFALGVPGNLVATAKGPTQINLTWTAAGDPGYGYVVEVQSAGDARYASYTELQPIPTGIGFACNAAIIIAGNSCALSDNGTPLLHVYNPVIHFVPTWVTESQYIDPTDGTAAQYIVTRLKNNTTYTFRVRTFSGMTGTTYGAYATPASAITASYALRYVAPAGSNAANGQTTGTAWQTLSYASGHLDCGQLLIVLAGSFTLGDYIAINKTCSANNRAVVQFNVGDTIDFPVDDTRISVFLGTLDGSGNLTISGDYIVLDGVKTRFVGTYNSNASYPWEIWSTHVALLGIDFSTEATNIPSAYGGVRIRAPYALMASSYVHDVGSPADPQNSSGASGFPVWMNSYGVFVNNHISRGGHDTGICLSDGPSNVSGTCQYNRYLNNVLDGGVGTGVNTGTYGTSGSNLIEGNIIYHPGFFLRGDGNTNTFKPCIQNSGQGAVSRRNICVTAGPNIRWIEYSSEGGAANTGNLTYNNTLYSSDGQGQRPLFISANGGVSFYDGTVIANNGFQNYLCDNGAGGSNQFATEVYLAVALITHNAWYVGGGTCNGGNVIYWNSNNAPEQTLRSFTYEESTYPTHWVGNAALAVAAQYVDVANMDFHLAVGSPLRGAGVRVTDTLWGFPSNLANPDVGAYGLVTSGGNASVSSAMRVSSRTSR